MEECPGLNLSKAIWYVPQGKNVTELTVCNQCRKKYSDIEVFVPVSDKEIECNCDGFLYGNRLDNGLFNISFWEDQSTYFDTTVDGEVYLKNGSKFNIFIHSKLSDTDYFKYEILCNDNVVVPLSSVAYKKDVKDGYTFHYIGEQDSSITKAISILKNTGVLYNTDKLTIRLYVFKLVRNPDLNDYSNKFLGDFVMINHNSITIKSTQGKESDYILKTKQQYNSSVILSTGKWIQCNEIPLEINIKPVSLGDSSPSPGLYLETLLKRSKQFIEARNEKNEMDVRRFKNMMREIELQIKELISNTQDNLNILDEIEVIQNK